MGPQNLQLQPKKSFGQNFLINRTAVESIVRSARESQAKRLLEIGPGAGALTELLLKDGRDLFAVELDPEAIAFQRERFGGAAHFHVLEGDAVTLPLPSGPSWSVVGNLPYNAATAILTRFLLEPISWERMVLMFQLEVGQKLMGKPSEKAYGPLSILAQLTCRMSRLMKLGPGSFHPAPKVDSAVLLFEPRQDALALELRRPMLDLLHRSFAHRRKTLSNNWNGWLDPGTTQALLKSEGLEASVRAEAIPPAKWPELLACLESIHRERPGQG